MTVKEVVFLILAIAAWVWPDAPAQLKLIVSIGLVALILLERFLPKPATLKQFTLADYLRLGTNALQGALIGLGAGLFLADQFFSQPVYEIVQFFQNEPGTAVPTGASTMAPFGFVVMAVGAIIGAVVAFMAEYRSLERLMKKGREQPKNKMRPG